MVNQDMMYCYSFVKLSLRNATSSNRHLIVVTTHIGLRYEFQFYFKPKPFCRKRYTNKSYIASKIRYFNTADTKTLSRARVIHFLSSSYTSLIFTSVVSSHLILRFKISRFRHISPLKYHTSFLFPHLYHAPSPSEAPTFHFHVTTVK